MASVRASLLALGASRDAADLALDALRPGTESVYAVYWARWVAYAQEQGFDPCHPRSANFANFLAHLSVHQGLSVSSLRGYRSAISTTLKQLGGAVRRSGSRSALVADVIRGAALREARCPRRLPRWDLFVVLEHLRSRAFEPLQGLPLRLLSFKTAFLLFLALGRRGSEVHAISGLEQDVFREPDGSYTLRFLPDFLAKNQQAGEQGPLLKVPSLCRILAPDDEDRFLCPCRSLSVYLARTRNRRRRGTCRRLFLSLNPAYKKDLTKSTLAQWLKALVRLAYLAAGLAVGGTQTHEVRAWSASLAFTHSVSVSQIREAAFWKGENTFSSFYLRDVSRLAEDGSRGMSSLAVSQTTVSARRL